MFQHCTGLALRFVEANMVKVARRWEHSDDDEDEGEAAAGGSSANGGDVVDEDAEMYHIIEHVRCALCLEMSSEDSIGGVIAKSCEGRTWAMPRTCTFQ
jgi:hypothetical protein